MRTINVATTARTIEITVANRSRQSREGRGIAKTCSMAGSHTLKVAVAPRGRSSRVDIDAFVVLR